MVTVRLHNLIFNAYHGIHEEEKVLGNEYIVNAAFEFHETDEVIVHIGDTINYEVIYNIIRERMSIPTPLLETVVMETGYKIHRAFPDLKTIAISVKKMHPPIEGMQGAAEVSWHKEF
jgi:dihydroneopterin aldolase